jgi:hypothetical protein
MVTYLHFCKYNCRLFIIPIVFQQTPDKEMNNSAVAPEISREL